MIFPTRFVTSSVPAPAVSQSNCSARTRSRYAAVKTFPAAPALARVLFQSGTLIKNVFAEGTAWTLYPPFHPDGLAPWILMAWLFVSP